MKLFRTALVASLAVSSALACSKKAEPAAQPQAVAPAAPAAPSEPAPSEAGDKATLAEEEAAPAEEEAAPAEEDPAAEAAEAPTEGAAPEAEAAPEPAEGAPAAAGANKLGFGPAEQGFKFPNYGNDPGIINLTAAELRRMFGDNVCGAIQGDVCTLTPPAANWMEAINKAMDGGHCEGFAALSLLMHAGKVPADTLGGSAPSLDRSNERLQRELAYWFSTQATSPTRESEIKSMTPKQIVVALETAFAAGTDGEIYTMGIYKPGYKDGHAITPYGVKPLEGGKTGIQVYDNNYPGVERIIEVDVAADTWQYSASTNPNEPSSMYIGDATTFTLTLTPTSKRLEAQVCPFCGELDAATGAVKGSVAGAPRTCEVWLDGDADVYVTDANGKRLGTVDGALISEIPGGTAVALKSESLWEDDAEPIYSVPVGKLTVSIDGSKVTEPTESDIEVIGPAFIFAVEGIQLDPGQKDEVFFSEDMRSIIYKTGGQESPVIELGITTDGADYLFAIKAEGEADGQEIELSVDPVKGELRFEVRAGEGDTAYGIELVRIDAEGEETFTHEGNSLLDDAAITLVYGDWKGQGTELTARLDKGDDGSVDETFTITDVK